MPAIVWIIFFIVFPIFIMYLCQKYTILDKIGAVVLCYAAGIIVGNINLFPENIFQIQNMFTMITIPLSLPLLFFSMDMKSWSRLAGKSLITFFAAIISVLGSTTLAFFLFRGQTNNNWRIPGMLIGCYTGGTPNLASIGTALKIDPDTYVAVHASDVVMGAIYILVAMTIMPKLLKKILPAFEFKNGNSAENIKVGFETNFTGFQKKHLKPLLTAFGLAILIFAVGGGLSLIMPEDISMVVAILSITTLGVAASFSTKIRNIDYTFQLGYYIILVFSLVVSSMANVKDLVSTAPIMLAYVTVAIFASAVIHTIFSKIFKIDADTQIVASVSFVLSPPFVPMIAAALKNKEIVVSGVIIGILGWVVGNYIGISYAYILKSLFT
ncbi:MAG: DUF819 family protein [Spirochaetales bacterium]|nr:DUF819 family protein [Spirochaetales bacterium]